jgi:nucleotidyltransferase substrate binding protein (TIGR01987 family)
MNSDIRWKQRFDNFSKAFALLQQTVEQGDLNIAERAGLIQFFEVAFELSWKVLKDYLVSEGYQVKTPRETLKKAFEIEIITDGHTWMEALQDRNLTTHTYDENISRTIENTIRERYFPAMQQLHAWFHNRS